MVLRRLFCFAFSLVNPINNPSLFDQLFILFQLFDKRAMMALDCSPESSQQNEFYLLCSYCSNLWPRNEASFDPRSILWIKLIKVHKEMLHTKNHSPIPSSFRKEEIWSWSSLFLCSNLWPPGWGIWTNLVEVHKEMLHTKYQSSGPYVLGQADF